MLKYGERILFSFYIVHNMHSERNHMIIFLVVLLVPTGSISKSFSFFEEIPNIFTNHLNSLLSILGKYFKLK